MKTSILTICISIFSLALFAQSPQKADITTKNERTSITQEELKDINDKKIDLNNRLEMYQAKYKANPSSEVLEEIESLKKRLNKVKQQEAYPIKKSERVKTEKAPTKTDEPNDKSNN
jgi:hypothetical protein